MMALKDMSQQLADHLPNGSEMSRWLGLQQHRSATDTSLAMLGAFALGTMVGGAVALLFAPRSGQELRDELGHRLDDARNRVNERVGEATQRVRETLAPDDARSAPAAGEGYPRA